MKTNTRNSRQKSYLHAACCALTSATLLLAGVFPASAFTAADATIGYNAWWSSFNTASIGWWTGAESIEMVEDAGNVSDINAMCNKFTTANGTSWSGNSFNDDVSWACIAFTRAYTATGDTTYRTIAKNNFDMMFARAWDTNAGGLWWNTSDNSKNACVNFPASIAAHLLSIALNDSSYATKSQNIFNWGKTNFFVASSGLVKDSLTSSSAYSYNLGTFMGAAFYNGDSADASKAGDYVKNTWGNNMQILGPTGDGAGFNGICLRWMAIAGYNTAYRQAVVNNAWGRRNTNNLVNCQWNTQTGNGAQDSWSCTDVVIAMMTVTPDGAGGVLTNGTYKIVNRNSGLAMDVKGLSTTNGSTVQQYAYNGGANQQWTVTSLVGGEYKIIGVQSGSALDVVGSGTANGTRIDIWSYNSGANQQWSFTATSGGYYSLTPANAVGSVLDVQHSATTNSAPLQIWSSNGGNSQQWILQAP
jgi:predicted alpha-1,6-mannanase (GH76 family)